MKKNYIVPILLLIAGCIAGCAVFQTGKSMPKQHPEKFTPMVKPICPDCHDTGKLVAGKPFSAYSHNDTYFSRHGSLANGSQAVCEACHQQSYCNDCHANKEKIVPSRKLGNRPDIDSPHKGDYFSKHKTEGRLNKTECFTCHGRRNNESCKQCH